MHSLLIDTILKVRFRENEKNHQYWDVISLWVFVRIRRKTVEDYFYGDIFAGTIFQKNWKSPQNVRRKNVAGNFGRERFSTNFQKYYFRVKRAQKKFRQKILQGFLVKKIKRKRTPQKLN